MPYSSNRIVWFSPRICLVWMGLALVGCANSTGGALQTPPHPPAAANGGGLGGGSVSDVTARDTGEVIVRKEIRLLVRDFTHPKIPQSGFWGYYGYLLFIERALDADATAHRRAAALAFMCQLSDVSQAAKFSIPNEYLAVIAAPIKDVKERKFLRTSVSGDALLSRYDFTAARVLAMRIGNAVDQRYFSIAMVFYPKRLTPHTNIDPNSLDIIDLSKASIEQITRIILQLRARLVRPVRLREVVLPVVRPGGTSLERYSVPDLAGLQPSPKSYVRRVLASLGRLVETLTPVTPAVAAEPGAKCL